MANETRRYLVIVSLSDTAPQRLQSLVPQLQDILARLSTEAVEMVFRSVTADVFGFFVRSTLAAGQIIARLESPGRDRFHSGASVENPVLSGDDSLFVIEMGEDFKAGKGFTRAGTWLQHH